jgi:hypothetical protein
MYEPPEWMTEHMLDALGGRELVVELMSGQRETPSTNMVTWVAQMDMEGRINLLERLHRDGLLTE